VLVVSICVDVAVKLPVGELVVVTVVERVPVITGLCVEVTVTGGAVVVVLEVVPEVVRRVVVWVSVRVEETVVVVGLRLTTT